MYIRILRTKKTIKIIVQENNVKNYYFTLYSGVKINTSRK